MVTKSIGALVLATFTDAPNSGTNLSFLRGGLRVGVLGSVFLPGPARLS